MCNHGRRPHGSVQFSTVPLLSRLVGWTVGPPTQMARGSGQLHFCISEELPCVGMTPVDRRRTHVRLGHAASFFLAPMHFLWVTFLAMIGRSGAY